MKAEIRAKYGLHWDAIARFTRNMEHAIGRDKTRRRRNFYSEVQLLDRGD